jgi:SAM-dependent methyltransferase
MIPTPWYETLFTGHMVDMQRSMPAPSQAEIEFIVQELQAAPGSRILDVPCGTGRVGLPLSMRGFRITGVDRTPEFLADARRAAAQSNLNAEFEERDMRNLPWIGHVDHAYCWGNSFAYMGDDGDLAFLKAVGRALKPGGTFALETHFCAEGLFIQRLQKRWFELNNMTILHDTEYDPATSILTSTYVSLVNNQRERKQAHYRIYTFRQLMEMFATAGFEVLNAYGSISREPYQIGSQGPWVIARRKS